MVSNLRLFIMGLALILLTNIAQADIVRVYYDFEITDRQVFAVKNYLDGELKAGDTLLFYICSPGGSVTASISLYDYLVNLRSMDIKVYTIASGMAYSGGSVLLQAGQKRYITPSTMVMVHPAYCHFNNWFDEFLYKLSGNDEALVKTNIILTVLYVAKTGKSIEEVRKDMSKDTWMYSWEAIEKGYADGLWEGEHNIK